MPQLDLQAPNFSALSALAGTRVGNLGLESSKSNFMTGLASGMGQSMDRMDRQKELQSKQQLAQQELGMKQQEAQQMNEYRMGMLKNQQQQNDWEKQKFQIEQMVSQRASMNEESLNKRGAFASSYILSYQGADTPEKQEQVKNDMLTAAVGGGYLTEDQVKQLQGRSPKELYNTAILDLMLTNSATGKKGVTGKGGILENLGQTTSNTSELTPATKTDMQKHQTTGAVQLERLKTIGKTYADEYLTWQGAAKGAYGWVADKAGPLGDSLPGAQDAKQFNAKKAAFVQDINRLFSAYVKEQTGAQFAFAELDRRKQEMINSDDPPQVFKAKYDSLINDMEKAGTIRNQLLQKGIKTDSKEFEEQFKHEWISQGGQQEEQLPGTFNGTKLDSKLIDETVKAYEAKGYTRQEVLDHIRKHP